MTKRSRKSAFGKANVVRRSSLKTAPVYTRDPLSLDRTKLRKNVRTTLMFGSALGASLMAMSVYSVNPANAAILCNPGAIVASPANYATPQLNGISCSTTAEDLTVVVTQTAGTPNIGGGNGIAPNGDGITITGTFAGLSGNHNLNLTNAGNIVNDGGAYGTTKNGIVVTLSDTGATTAGTDTITVTNTGQIGTSGTHVTGSGIAVNASVSGWLAGDATLNVFVTNSGAIFDNTAGGTAFLSSFDSFWGSSIPGISGSLPDNGIFGIGTSGRAYSNYGDPTVHMTIANSGPIVTAGTALGSLAFAASTIAPSTATVSITNTATGVLTSTNGFGFGIAGIAVALGTPSATASVIEVNAGAIGTKATPFAFGMFGLAISSASQTSAIADATGGTAISTASATNSGAIYSSKTGILEDALSFANGTSTFAGGKGYGGSATSTVVVANNTGGTIVSTTSFGIYGFAGAYANGSSGDGIGKGGTAVASDTVTNSAAVTSGTNANADAIYAGAVANANGTGNLAGSTSKGGSATATTLITNNAGGTLKSGAGEGIDGYSLASATANSKGAKGNATGGVSNATTTITNAGVITAFHEGILGGSVANSYALSDGAGGKASAGTATAGTVITNSAAITSKGTSGSREGIEGSSNASANAVTIGAGGTSIGGTATAATTVTNNSGGNITSVGNGIEAFSTALADGKADPAPGSTGKGGTASATVIASNAATIISTKGIGMLGVSFAGPNGYGYNAAGGVGNAQTTMTNAGPIYSFLGGVNGIAIAIDDAFAPVVAPVAPGTGSTATGGTSTANVLVSNTGTIVSKYGVDLLGFTIADASAFGGFTAKGGTSIATTTITNNKTLTVYDGIGIFGTSTAGAVAITSPATKGTTATGGTANATTSISNSGTIYAGSEGLLGIVFGGDGILGVSASAATATGFTATGGTATATTSITNSGNLFVYGNFISPFLSFIPLLGGDGIDGIAVTDASGIGSFASPAVGSKVFGVGTGGVATSTVQINSTGTTIQAHYGNGILGATLASANGVGFHGYGGKATATTNIANSANIYSDAGIYGFAVALALGIGSPIADPGVGKGGTAAATVSIGNTGNINSTFPVGPGGGFGILGSSIAVAGAIARQATGGTATANTTISNSGTIFSQNDGINGSAFALADGIGFYGIKGLAKGGLANATVTITSAGPNIYSLSGYGIKGTTFASASGLVLGFGNGTGGTANATTTITSAGKIVTYGGGNDAINGTSAAFALGSKTGGTANATTTITNNGGARSIYTTGSGSLGILASSYSNADGATGGLATSKSTVSNNGSIYTTGSTSIGIQAGSTAHADTLLTPALGLLGGKGGTASATSSVTNTSQVLTTGSGSVGVLSYSLATALGIGGSATASTTVANNAGASIYTTGSTAAGIVATSTAAAGTYLTGTATATTNVNNAGAIDTAGTFSAGVVSLAGAYSGGKTTSTATANTTNSGGIVTTGTLSAGIFSATVAAGTAGKGSSSGNASATTTVTNSGLIATGGFFSAGVAAFSNSQGYYSATSNTQVTNSGGITTGGTFAPGIVAGSYALATGLTGPASATTNVVNTNKILTTGTLSTGIVAFSTAIGDGTANTTVANSGSIITKGTYSYGVNATSFTNEAIGDAASTTSVSNSVAGTIKTYGYGATGIFGGATALATTGNATATSSVVNNGSIATTGSYAYGVYLSNYARALKNATAAVSVTNGGSITTSGSHAPGVLLYAGAFSATGVASATALVANAGSIITTGTNAPAISATVFGDSSIIVRNYNGGVIKSTGRPYTVIAATVQGGQAGSYIRINNYFNGTIQGNVQLSGAAQSIFNNAGTWIMQGNSSFGAGKNDVFNNSLGGTGGTVKMLNSNRDFAAAGAGYYVNGPVLSGFRGNRFHTIVVSGLENFNNDKGLVTMVNGYANQQIALSGNFNGTAAGATTSTLAVDAFLGAPGSRADILAVGGNVTGLTNIVVNDINPGLGAYNPVGIPVVVVGGTTSLVNGFQLPGGPIVKGLFDYDLYLNTNKNVWVLASTPNDAANELPRLITAVSDIWHLSAGTWADRSADLRAYYSGAPACDPRMVTKAPCLAPASIGPGAWARVFGDWAHSDGTADETLFGKTHSYDVSYHQDTYGVQAGMDFSAQRMGYENFVFGLMVGAVSSKVNFASGTQAKFDGGNIGAYATYINRGFFANSLLMANILNVNYNHSALLNSTGNALTFGGHFDMGYRFNFKEGWFAEPLVTVEGMYTDFRNVNLAGVYLNLDNMDARGRLGVRVGTSFVNGGYRIEPSVTASVWHAFTGDNAASFGSGVYTFNLEDVDSHKTYGEIGGALNFLEIASRWSGFVKGDFRFSDNYTGGSVKGGVRFQW